MKIKKPRHSEEHEIQKNYFSWVRTYRPKIPELNNIWANINGARLGVRERIKMKDEGMEAGIPDITVAIPALGKLGLFFEVKRPKGTLSKEQKIMKRRLEAAGYLVQVCYSFEELRDKTLAYINCQDIYPSLANEN